MDPKIKTALAVVIGMVIGMTLLGGAVALPVAFHAVAVRASVADRDGFGMMGRSQGMMGRDRGPQWDDRAGAGRNGFVPNADGICPNADHGRGGMRGRGQFGPQDGSGIRPNGGICPNLTDEPATES